MAKNIDLRKTNFTSYCQALNVIGKNILVKLLKWFYKGGDANYLDYLNSEYNLDGMDDLIHATRRYDLMNKNPDEFDMTLIHVLLQLTCNLYEEKTQDNKDDFGYKIIEHGVESLVFEHISTTRMKPSLTDSELEEKLRRLNDIYEELIKTGGRLSGVTQEEIEQLFVDTSIGLGCLNDIEKCNLGFVKKRKKFLPPQNILHKLELETERSSSKDRLKKMDETAIFKDILDEKYMAFAQELKNRNTVGLDDEYENQTQVDQELLQYMASKELSQCFKKKVKSASAEKSELGDKLSSSKRVIQLRVSQAKGTNIIYSAPGKENVDTGVNNTISLDTLSSSDNLTPREEKQRMVDLQAKISLSLTPSNTYKKGHMPQGVSPSLLYTDTDIMLKQHEKYSRRPSQQVKLQDMFSVEGMNDKVAEIFIVSGEGGMGKTMLLNYILEIWSTSQNVIENLESRDLLFFHELKNNSCSTFTDLVLNTLKSKIENLVEDSNILKTVVLEMPILVILDGYDESCEKSCQLVKEVVQMSGSSLRIIISSRPQYVDSIYRQIPKQRKKHVSHLSLNGIPSTHRADIVSRLIDSRLTGKRDEFHIERIKSGLINRLPELHDAIGEDLCNPLMITIITEMWLENPFIESDDSTKHVI